MRYHAYERVEDDKEVLLVAEIVSGSKEFKEKVEPDSLGHSIEICISLRSVAPYEPNH